MRNQRAILTARRLEILKLIAKGYNNKQIARKMHETLSSIKMQKWRLYIYLGGIHTAIDAVFMGLQKGHLQIEDICEPMREEIYGDIIGKATQVLNHAERERFKLVYIPDKQKPFRHFEEILRAV